MQPLSELPKLFRDLRAMLAENMNMLRRVEARLAIPTAAAAAVGAEEATLPLPVTVENIHRAIDDFFPAAKGWDLIAQHFQPMNLTSGQSKEIINYKESGFIIGGLSVSNSPRIRYRIKIKGVTEWYEVTATPEEMYDLGLTEFNQFTYWVSRYDPVANVYVANTTPNPWPSYHSQLIVTLENEDTTTIRYLQGIFLRLVVEEEE